MIQKALSKSQYRIPYSICVAICLCIVVPSSVLAVVLQSKALLAWDRYVSLTEKRVGQELHGSSGFLRLDFMSSGDSAKAKAVLKSGKVYVERLKTKDDGKEIVAPDALIHHWYGAIFLPGMKVEPLVRWIQDYDQQYKYFKEVEKSRLLSHNGDNYKVYLRFMRTKVVTVHYNTEHNVDYESNGAGRSSSRSISTKIAEIEKPGTPSEKEMAIGNDSGYMWRLNSYWRFREQDGGVMVECESVSLSRGIPYGLGWLIGEYVEAIPRESLESALTSIRDGVRSIR